MWSTQETTVSGSHLETDLVWSKSVGVSTLCTSASCHECRPGKQPLHRPFCPQQGYTTFSPQGLFGHLLPWQCPWAPVRKSTSSIRRNYCPGVFLRQAQCKDIDDPQNHLPHTLWISASYILVNSTFYLFLYLSWLQYREKTHPFSSNWLPQGDVFLCCYVACVHGKGRAREVLIPQVQSTGLWVGSLSPSGSKHILGIPYPPPHTHTQKKRSGWYISGVVTWALKASSYLCSHLPIGSEGEETDAMMSLPKFLDCWTDFQSG